MHEAIRSGPHGLKEYHEKLTQQVSGIMLGLHFVNITSPQQKKLYDVNNKPLKRKLFSIVLITLTDASMRVVVKVK